ncbi:MULTISPECIES: response regulator transcription factor [unclassified Paenibacillus]|uniref:response regulator transcription factor n=1 Tax=unclassified Paenibacillus TaxID=185978 RepID=UPI002404DC74|nr:MULTISPECIES: response regulator transcription factor [unclassified Paenibacillus]MDF9844785.1 OmpR family two-component system bacitracin resistance response regulator BceR [Paenibacillus sp. PastF-2]MDF9851414.1 OmpR family two-component system bacitracin resistance response regulator BceR [Paenibacillus sp. PastM-2]MDF9857969.1 OmpR family two-component system bacitracin resistance response regulator BceR [Paenibacillus sp. PastF-1]MDH6483237.1 OmpR family two-component system bacitracin 
MFKIMLIEDDVTLFTEIKERLSQWSYDIYGVTDFAKVLQEFTAVQPELVIIDIQLPLFDGFHWCRMIRAHSNVPIIFLSSRDHPSDMVMSMQLGADDFMQKPFHFDVLIAKIQATLRRVYNYSTERTELRAWRGATIEYVKNTVTNSQGAALLTKNEMFILKILIEHKDRIVDREELIKNLWDNEHFVSDNTLTVNVNRLRKKLEPLGLDAFIETRVGQGYMATEEAAL